MQWRPGSSDDPAHDRDDTTTRLRGDDSLQNMEDTPSIRWATPIYRLHGMQRSADHYFRLRGSPHAVSKSRPASSTDKLVSRTTEYRLHGNNQDGAQVGTTNSIGDYRVPVGPPQYRLRGSVPVPIDKFTFPRSKRIPFTLMADDKAGATNIH